MTAVVFAGPTIIAQDITSICDALILPPVAMGDVYRAGTSKPRAIGIIDGFFEGVPSVWHKEILWAMSSGIAVYGAASMGAIRAAELHQFGMRGIGEIFAGYCDGTYEDDDEVALQHGPQEAGYIALSEPMVNIRATLHRAGQQKIITPHTAERLTHLAKSRFYPERNWRDLLGAASEERFSKDELQSLEAWLPTGRVDQKRKDALKMLKAMATFLAEENRPPNPDYRLQWTVMWDQLVHLSGDDAGGAEELPAETGELIIDELKLHPDHYEQIRRNAVLSYLASHNIDQSQFMVSSRDARRGIARFRAANGLYSKAVLEDWLHQNDLDAVRLERQIIREEQLRLVATSLGSELNQQMLDELRLSGEYAWIADRARRKQQWFEDCGRVAADQANSGLSTLQLQLWYFEERLGHSLPDDVDQFIAEGGFADVAQFNEALFIEFLFSAHETKETC